MCKIRIFQKWRYRETRRMSNNDLVALTSQGMVVWALVAAVFALAGVVKGVIGLGLPTMSMALLAIWMPPVAAASLLIVPSFVTNVWQLQPLSTLRRMARRLGGMQGSIAVGTLAGAWTFGAPAGAGASVALGLLLVCYAVWGIFAPRFTIAATHERWLGPLAGVLTGAITALTGVFVLPAVVYVQSLAMGLSFTTSTVALAWSSSDTTATRRR
jgi:uncharacterized membrane protein YfcA